LEPFKNRQSRRAVFCPAGLFFFIVINLSFTRFRPAVPEGRIIARKTQKMGAGRSLHPCSYRDKLCPDTAQRSKASAIFDHKPYSIQHVLHSFLLYSGCIITSAYFSVKGFAEKSRIVTGIWPYID
jgi:hypothetical protein